MTKRSLLIVLTLLASLQVGCKKDREPNKIIAPLPVTNEQTVIAASAAQQMMLLKKSLARFIVTTLNKTTMALPVYPELTSAGGSSYSFVLNDSHFGSASYTIQFKNGSGAAIDPISAQSSSTTIKTVDITGTGASTLFPSYTETATLTLATEGDVNSVIRLTGSITFNGSGYSIPFDVASPGARVNIEGLRDGAILVTAGTGPSGPVTMTLSISNDHSANGPISWEGQTGGLHITGTGEGFVTTSTSLIPLN